MTDDRLNEARNRNLLRFVHAQDSGGIYDGTGTYAEALQEVKAGHKRGHWIWYVFPHLMGHLPYYHLHPLRCTSHMISHMQKHDSGIANLEAHHLF